MLRAGVFALVSGVAVAVVEAAVPVDALAFSPNGKILALNRHRLLQFHDVESADNVFHELDLPRITSVRFSPDGKWLGVTGGLPGSRGELRLFAWRKGKSFAKRDSFSDTANALAFHPQGRSLAVGASDRNVLIYAMKDGRLEVEPTHTLTDHSRPVLSLEYSPDGKILVTASADRSLKVWNAETGELIRSLGNHTEIVHAIAMRPPVTFAGRLLPTYCASGSDDHTVRVWQPGIGRMVRIVRYHEAPVFALGWHPKGDRIYSAGKDGVIRVIDGDSDEILSKWKAHDDWIYSLAVSPDGKHVATGDWAGRVKIWESKNEAVSLARELPQVPGN